MRLLALSLLCGLVSLTGLTGCRGCAPAALRHDASASPSNSALVLRDGGPPVPPVDAGPTPCAVEEIRCDGLCYNPRQSLLHCGACGRACAPDARCDQGRCAPVGCPPGQRTCGDKGCVITAIDPNHCGRCGRRCAAGQACAAGRCVRAPAPSPVAAPVAASMP